MHLIRKFCINREIKNKKKENLVIMLNLNRKFLLSIPCCLMIIIAVNNVHAGVKYKTPFSGALTNTSPIEATADDLNYDKKTGEITAKGHVVIKKGNVSLKAQYVRVNADTGEAMAYGDVVLQEGDSVWTGDSLNYNFNKQLGKAEGFSGQYDIVRVLSNKSIEQKNSNTFILHDAMITTCTNDAHHCHYRVKAKKAEIVQNDYVKVKGAVFYLGKVPSMYLPYWKRSINDDFGWELEPGHSSRLGFFLRSAYRYRFNDVWKGKTHLDLYSERGVGGGQDLFWESNTFGTGGLETYFINDDKPVPDGEDPDTYGVDSSRYRIKLDHYVALSPRDYILARGNYLSDKYVLRDFFEDEYRITPVPENDATYTHRGQHYTFNILARGRVNDFFESINRLPEASLDITRQQLGNSDFYYESRTTASYLEHVFAKDDTNNTDIDPDYSSSRFDTVHRIFYPKRFFGFLNIIPRTGIRGTYYSDTGEKAYATNVITITHSNSPATYQTNTIPYQTENGSDFRTQFEIGMEASFKAFRVFDRGPDKSPLRHVAEPYIDYSYLSDPNLEPNEIYQFDSIDTFKKNNKIKIGMRNKLQTKRESGSANLFDIDLYTHLNLSPEGDEQTLENIVMDTEMYPSDGTRIDFDGVYDTDKNVLQTFNTRLQIYPKKKWSFYGEYRHIDNESDLLIGSLILKVTRNWYYNIYARYEAKDSMLQETGGYIQRNFDCMTFRLGGRYLPGYTYDDDNTNDEDDFKVMFEFWFNNIPGVNTRKHDKHGFYGI